LIVYKGLAFECDVTAFDVAMLYDTDPTRGPVDAEITVTFVSRGELKNPKVNFASVLPVFDVSAILAEVGKKTANGSGG